MMVTQPPFSIRALSARAAPTKSAAQPSPAQPRVEREVTEQRYVRIVRMSYPRPEHGPLLAKFGQMISTWNDVEYQWRSALLMFEHPETYEVSGTAQIMAAHLGSLQLLDAAKTLAAEILTDECQSLITEAIAQLNILREYRNYYVHGFQGVGWRPDGTPLGYLLTVTARGRLVQHDGWFGESDLDVLIEHLNSLRLVFGATLLVWRKQIDPSTQMPYCLPVLGPRPERLEKSKRLLFEYRTGSSVL